VCPSPVVKPSQTAVTSDLQIAGPALDDHSYIINGESIPGRKEFGSAALVKNQTLACSKPLPALAIIEDCLNDSASRNHRSCRFSKASMLVDAQPAVRGYP
jgi:hypothetical protein